MNLTRNQTDMYTPYKYAQLRDLPLSELPVPLYPATDEPECVSEQRQPKPRPRRTLLRLFGHEEEPEGEGGEDHVQHEHGGDLMVWRFSA